jgi:hypothetical protein
MTWWRQRSTISGVYLSTTPLLGLTVIMLACQAAWGVHRRSGSSPLANPVKIAVAALAMGMKGLVTALLLPVFLPLLQ